MLDLVGFTENFIQSILPESDSESQLDELTIQAVSGKGFQQAAREAQLRRWLNHYKVLMFFPPENSQRIVEQILGFADRRQALPCPLTKDQILAEYENLRQLIQRVAPKLKDGHARAVGSLTSKALWCCLPDDVPIFDHYALSALQIIARLSGRRFAKTDSEYACFVEAWFWLYDELRPVIDEASQGSCKYKVRVLDRLLWHLGQPTFDFSSPSQAVGSADAHSSHETNAR